MSHKFFAFGYITKHPEVKNYNGHTFVKLPFATTSKVKTHTGETIEQFLYIDVLLGPKILENYPPETFSKGMALFVEGKIRIKTLENIGNIVNKKLELIATDIQAINVKNEISFKNFEVPEFIETD